MFTGLIEKTGSLKKIASRGNYLILEIESEFASSLTIGESIACDGACLTVVSFDSNNFVVEVSQESIVRTIIKKYHIGAKINLERALKMGDRLGGHLVSGHIDDTGVVDYLKSVGGSLELAVKYDNKYDSLIIEKGSIAINGISLTVNQTGPGWFSVNIIPHTASLTTIDNLKKNDEVNLEFDMIGKYILKNNTTGKEKNSLTKDKLIESGW